MLGIGVDTEIVEEDVTAGSASIVAVAEWFRTGEEEMVRMGRPKVTMVPLAKELVEDLPGVLVPRRVIALEAGLTSLRRPERVNIILQPTGS
jgi:hypothetical protein